MKQSQVTMRPRLPHEAQVRLRQGGSHKNKKRYDRKREKVSLRQEKYSHRVSCPIFSEFQPSWNSETDSGSFKLKGERDEKCI